MIPAHGRREGQRVTHHYFECALRFRVFVFGDEGHVVVPRGAVRNGAGNDARGFVDGQALGQIGDGKPHGAFAGGRDTVNERRARSHAIYPRAVDAGFFRRRRRADDFLLMRPFHDLRFGARDDEPRFGPVHVVIAAVIATVAHEEDEPFRA